MSDSLNPTPDSEQLMFSAIPGERALSGDLPMTVTTRGIHTITPLGGPILFR